MHHYGGNIQYNGAQSSQTAMQPSDATASNTFINQNRQAFGNSGQYSNTAQNIQPNFKGQFTGNQQKESSQLLSGHQESSSLSTGQYGQPLNDKFKGHFGLSHGGYGLQNSHFGVQNEQQALVSPFGSQSSQFTSQTDQQALRPQHGVQSAQFGFQTNKQVATRPFSSQSNQAVSGSAFGIQSNKPSPSYGSNSAFSSQQFHTDNQDFKPQNSFGANYLPPSDVNGRPSFNKPPSNKISSSQNSNKDNQIPNFVPLEGQNQGSAQDSTATLLASVGSAGLQSEAVQGINGLQNQPSRPNQLIYNNGQIKPNLLPTSLQSNGSPISGLPIGATPTAIPNIELTTPLEPNEKPAFSQSSNYNSQSTPSFGNLGSQPANGQAQLQAGLQNIASDSRPQGSTQFDSSSPAPTAFSATFQSGNSEDSPQSSLSFTSQNQQSNAYYSTQKPSFSQGPDDSYYYNQPSKYFGTPAARPQGSRFPSTPSYQFNSMANQLINQSDSNQFQNSPSITTVVQTSSELTQTQGSFSAFNNGITQASISPFPPVSTTILTQYDSKKPDSFVSKPRVPSFSSIPSLQSSKPTSFGLNPSTFLNHDQNQYGHISINTNVPTAAQSYPYNPATTFGQISSTSLGQNQITQNSASNDQSEDPKTPLPQEPTSTQTQQYDGTVYEYNKPPEVLPAQENNDSSSSQSIKTDSTSKLQESKKPNTLESKPQLELQQNQFGQNTVFSSLPQTLNMNKPSVNAPPQLSQSTLSTLSQESPDSEQPTKPNGSAFLTTAQFGHSAHTGSSSKPFLTSQPGSFSKSTHFGQNQPQQTQGAQHSVQQFRPFGESQSTTTQFGQKTQTTFGSPTKLNSAPQLPPRSNKPFSSSSSSQFGQTLNLGTSTNSLTSKLAQNSQIGTQAFRPFGASSIQTAQPTKPFGTSQDQDFRGYSSSKPQFGTHLFSGHFSQDSEQTFSATHGNTQPANKEEENLPDQTQPNHASNPPLASLQSTQFSLTASTPQFSVQPQFSQNQYTPIKPFNSASSQSQFGQNSAEASSSTGSQPTGIKAYKPYGALSPSGQSHNQPHFDQAPQTSQTVTTSSTPQFGALPFKSTGVNQDQTTQNQSLCCKGTSGSAISPLNVGKPSQAFAQTQSQFSGFQGAVGFNAQSLTGKGEDFGGPRKPPSFDSQTGYHY